MAQAKIKLPLAPIRREHIVSIVRSYFPIGGHSVIRTQLKNIETFASYKQNILIK